MIKNTEENLKMIEEYVNNRDFNKIKINELINFFAYKAGTKGENVDKLKIDAMFVKIFATVLVMIFNFVTRKMFLE